MTFLLDVNVLIAILDSNHVHHTPAMRWFTGGGKSAWATCSITEIGVLRIMGRASYVSQPGGPAEVADLLLSLKSSKGHTFWADDISLISLHDRQLLARVSSHHVTDLHLLALAQSKGGRLATFDRRIPHHVLPDGGDALMVIPA